MQTGSEHVVERVQYIPICLCMYVCMYECMFVCLYTYIYIYMYRCVCVRVCICICTAFIWIDISLSLYPYIYIYTYNVFVDVYIYIYMYIHTRSHAYTPACLCRACSYLYVRMCIHLLCACLFILYGCFYKLRESFFVGVLLMRAPLLGVYIGAPDFWKLPCGCMLCTWTLKRLPFHDFGFYVSPRLLDCTVLVLGPKGSKVVPFWVLKKKIGSHTQKRTTLEPLGGPFEKRRHEAAASAADIQRQQSQDSFRSGRSADFCSSTRRL